MDFLKFQLVIGALVRWGMTLLAGVLVSQGALTDEGKAEFIAAGAALLIPLIWSIIQKLRHVQTVDKALRMPSASTREDLRKSV